MPIHQILADFKNETLQCEMLIANAHANVNGTPILSLKDQEQITIAAFLNLFIAWETFLESSMLEYMLGGLTVQGTAPKKYVSPPTATIAQDLIKGTNKYFDYGNHDNLKKIVKVYFENGYPYEPHLSSIFSDLQDLKTIRNACAHITTTTKASFESLVQRIFSTPIQNLNIYKLLVSADPRLSNGETVFSGYKNKLEIVAELIANG